MLEKYLSCSDAFEDPYNLTNVVLWMKTNKQMNVVFVIAKLLDGQIVPLFKFDESITHSGDNLLAQKSFAVLHGKNEVVMGVVDTVKAFGDCHAFECIRKPTVFILSLNGTHAASRGENGDFKL